MAASGAMSRNRASTASVLLQVVAVLLVALTVAVVMLWQPVPPAARVAPVDTAAPGPWDEAQERARREWEADRAKREAVETDAPAVSDPATIAEMLEQAGHIKRTEVAAETPVEAASEVSEGDEAPPPLGGGIATYLGAVRVGDERWGLFRLGASQGLMRAGAQRGFLAHGQPGEAPVTLEVISVADDHAVVREAGAERRLDKAARSEQAVSVAAAVTGAAPVASNPLAGADGKGGRTGKEAGGPGARAALPRVEDFRKPDGTVDRAGFAAAMRSFQSGDQQSTGLDAGDQGEGGRGAGTGQVTPRRPVRREQR